MIFSIHRSSIPSYYYDLRGSPPITTANRAKLPLLLSILHFALDLWTCRQFLLFPWTCCRVSHA